jgi:hypothetical protein
MRKMINNLVISLIIYLTFKTVLGNKMDDKNIILLSFYSSPMIKVKVESSLF